MNQIKLKKEQKDEMLLLIKQYFLEHRDEEIGDLAAIMFLDFITDQLAPEFYNQGIYDSYTFMNDKLEDLFGIQIFKRNK